MTFPPIPTPPFAPDLYNDHRSGQVEHEKLRFQLADTNSDGKLSLSEFPVYLTPDLAPLSDRFAWYVRRAATNHEPPLVAEPHRPL